MANLTMLDDDWGAKGAQMTGAQVQQIIKDALKQCAKWATEPELAEKEVEGGYVVINIDGVPKKISIQKLTKEVDKNQEGLGQAFINEIFGLPMPEETV